MYKLGFYNIVGEPFDSHQFKQFYTVSSKCKQIRRHDGKGGEHEFPWLKTWL